MDELLLKLPQQIQRVFQDKKNQFSQLARAFQQEVQRALSGEKNTFLNSVKEFEFQVKHKMTHSNQVLSELRNQIRSSSGYLLDTHRNKQQNLINLLQIHTKTVLNSEYQTVTNREELLIQAFPRKIQRESAKLEQAELHLKLLDPITVLQRGYAIVTNEKGVLSKKNQAKAGEELKIVTEAQELKAKVK